MPIRDLQATLTEVGRIRLGLAPGSTDNPDRYPAKLDTFRFTSRVEHLIRGVAELYGGEARPWSPQGGGPNQFEVITTEAAIPVFVPRQKIDPWYEQWGGGVCTRRCDGLTDIIHDQACTCKPDDRVCKPTVRANLMLADLPGAGTWRLESHGFYAASELSALSPMIEVTQMPLPGVLMLQQRERKYFDRKAGKPQVKKYPVPVVLFDSLTARALMDGAATIHAALTGQQPAQVGGGQERPAIGGSAQPAGPDPQVVAKALDAIAKATTREGMIKIREAMASRGLADHAALTEEWNARARQIAQQEANQRGKPPVASAQTAGRVAQDVQLPAQDVAPEPPDDPAEGEEEPDRGMAFMGLAAAAKTKMGIESTAELEALAQRGIGKTLDQADGFELETLTDMVKKGQVK